MCSATQKIPKANTDAIVLVGTSTRIPKVSAVVDKLSQQKKTLQEQNTSTEGDFARA